MEPQTELETPETDITDRPKKSRTPALVAGLIVVLVAGFYAVHTAIANDGKADDQAAEESEDAKDDAKKDEKTPIPVRTAAAERGAISSYISATANLVAENEVTILAEWEGRIDGLAVEEGDRVQAGTVLATLARTDGEIAVQMARVRAENARIQFERGEKLVAQELLADDGFEKLAVEKALAEQQLKEAEWNLEKTMIRAPFAGRVTVRRVQLGQHVRRGDELFTVTDYDPLVARIFLPEGDVLRLHEGREVKLTLKADATTTVAGRIQRIAPVVDTATGTVKVTVEAVAPPAAVRPGAFVRVDIVRDTHADAVLVPKESVVRELQNAFVFVAKDDGTAEKRAVTLGLEESGRIEATSGLAGGEPIVVAGQGGLKDGSPIKVLGDDAETAGAEGRAAETAR